MERDRMSDLLHIAVANGITNLKLCTNHYMWGVLKV